MKIKPDKHILEKQYITLGMTIGLLAFMHSVEPSKIRAWLSEYNIPRRDSRSGWKRFSTRGER